jgi:excinuclease ABC subunit A
VRIGEGEQMRGIFDISHTTLGECFGYFNTLKLHGAKAEIADKVVREIASRLKFLNDVGLNYLSLDRSADTLSGGEAQRIRLASQIGSGLTGVMYVLDEPSIGLHQRDNDRLIDTLKHLRDIGNSVLVVEHDEDMIRAADFCVDWPLLGASTAHRRASQTQRLLARGSGRAEVPTQVAQRCIGAPSDSYPWCAWQQPEKRHR